MKIIVQSDDGKTQASFPVAMSGTPAEVAAAIAHECGEAFGRQLADSITVTDVTPPDDGFKFRVGQKVKVNDCKAEIAERFKFEGKCFYTLKHKNGNVGSIRFYDYELEPAE